MEVNTTQRLYRLHVVSPKLAKSENMIALYASRTIMLLLLDTLLITTDHINKNVCHKKCTYTVMQLTSIHFRKKATYLLSSNQLPF